MAFQISAQSGPVDEALRATETPDTLRAAFTVTLESPRAMRIYDFDPRRDAGERWQLVDRRGSDEDLDAAAMAWAREAAPDGRLFPDDLRASMGRRVEVSDLGMAWRAGFHHKPSLNDSDLDVWFAERVDAEAWLDPESGRFLRIDYSLPHPVRGPDGGRLTEFQQSYLLETEPHWGLSYIASYTMSLEAKGGFTTIRRNYTATVTSIDFFFASHEAEADFEAERHPATGRNLAGR
ncbi:hypothetical protein [Henriciella aquimarina]|uniref:hypothetical protein n=1 Tax=Henriciella aquimarina TaxID=545261 RepID=UPI00117A2471|nr:hypothetical protein [Henriciella aquimarina]